MKKYLFKGAVLTALLGFELVIAQSLGLQRAGQSIMNEVAGLFPYIAAIGLAITGGYALIDFGKNKDYMEALKIVLFYILAVVIIVAAYQFVKSQSL